MRLFDVRSLVDKIARRRVEGLLVPSATRLPDDVLIIFPDNMRPTSSIAVVEIIDPVLYIARSP
jgi:hypothetical protein